MTTTKQYDYLNRLTQISSAPSASGLLPLAYAYSYNAANQRTQNTFSDGSHWVYQYDSLGQVISGKRYWSDAKRGQLMVLSYFCHSGASYGRMQGDDITLPLTDPFPTMYRYDTGHTHWRFMDKAKGHTHHYIVTQSGPYDKKPCVCRESKNDPDSTDGNSPATGEILEVPVTGGGIEYYYAGIPD